MGQKLSILEACREWLEIPVGDTLPDHYTVLGLATFERNVEKIDAAARARISAVRARCLKYPEVGSRLLNHISAARVCLVDQASKTEYDAALRLSMAGSTTARAEGGGNNASAPRRPAPAEPALRSAASPPANPPAPPRPKQPIPLPATIQPPLAGQLTSSTIRQAGTSRRRKRPAWLVWIALAVAIVTVVVTLSLLLPR